MISFNLSNRLVFIFSLLGLAVTSFLFYEYTFASTVYCLVGTGCNIVRNSPFATIWGISIPIFGIFYYLTMAVFTIIRSEDLYNKTYFRLQLWATVLAVSFGVYLTFLEFFIILAVCFWCILSFIISILILLSILLIHENRN